MLTIGEIFKKTRLSKKLSLTEVEKVTKIRQKYIEALEENKFDKLPPPTFTKGFIKNYSDFLSLDAKQLLLLYRREFDEKKETDLLPKGVSKPLNIPVIRITSNSILTFLILGFIGLFFVYLFSQYLTIALAPSLNVYEPKDKSIVKSESIAISGKTDSDVKILINDQSISVNQDGSFSQKLKLQNGPNTLVIVAVNKRNRATKITRSITVQAP